QKGVAGWPTTPTATLTDPAAHVNDRFGLSVAVAGTIATVDAGGTDGGNCFPTVYIYAQSIAGWPTTPTSSLTDPRDSCVDSFGVSMALSRSTLVVGTQEAAGAAFIYRKSPTGLPTTPIATLVDPAPTGADFFGQSVALSGTTAVVGAYNANSAAG